MKIAVITGASSGLGKEYAFAVSASKTDIDEIWLIARREDKLLEVSESISKKVRILPLDITDDGCIKNFTDLLKSENPEVSLLINNAGFGRIGNLEKICTEDNAGMVRLNCEALTVMTSIILPYMKEGGEIINTCSIASFAPNYGMTVYSSTKAYVMSFSRGLRCELKQRKINVLAVCPGPMDTEFLPVAGIEPGVSRTFDTLPRVNPSVVARKSLIASSKKKAVYTNRFFYKFYRVLAKILPHNIVMELCKV